MPPLSEYPRMTKLTGIFADKPWISVVTGSTTVDLWLSLVTWSSVDDTELTRTSLDVYAGIRGKRLQLITIFMLLLYKRRGPGHGHTWGSSLRED